MSGRVERERERYIGGWCVERWHDASVMRVWCTIDSFRLIERGVAEAIMMCTWRD